MKDTLKQRPGETPATIGHVTIPICDFVRGYAEGGTLRLHMPGHKGRSRLGCEPFDITEIHGADSLWEADGIIAESERNASALFGTPTFYSTEGSSLCIRAMLWLAMLKAVADGKKPLIAAGRNAHRTFLAGAAVLDLPIRWLWPEDAGGAGYLSCPLTPEGLEAELTAWEKEGQAMPTAVYITTPDYLGRMLPVSGLAEVCHRHGLLLLVDNAHGAYLRFLTPSRHPSDEGADLVCDSAHKTLPVLTGGAYLHVAPSAGELILSRAKEALALFASTSPSYLILQSLDNANAVLADGYSEILSAQAELVKELRAELERHGLTTVGDECMKLTLAPRAYGLSGRDAADELRAGGIECEFADPDYIVFMITPDTGREDLSALREALLRLTRRDPLPAGPRLSPADRPTEAMTPAAALRAGRETLPLPLAVGRILADVVLSCPPAVPLVVCGERITQGAADVMAYYGTTSVRVVAAGDPGAPSVKG